MILFIFILIVYLLNLESSTLRTGTWKDISTSELVANSALGDTRLGENIVVSASPAGMGTEKSGGGIFFGTLNRIDLPGVPSREFLPGRYDSLNISKMYLEVLKYRNYESQIPNINNL